MKYLFIITVFVLIVSLSLILNQFAQTNSIYEGLPTVPCIDYTKPITQRFIFTIHININNSTYPLEKTIGHDYGNCLHYIYVTDTSGKVVVESNDQNTLILGQFFDVWHRAFSQNQIFGYQTSDGHTLSVVANGKNVVNFRETLLTPNEDIQIVYK